MPTFDVVSAQGETDMGWAVSRVTGRHPVTGAPTEVTVQCKACRVAFAYRLDHGGVVSGFDHAPTCPIYAGIHAHTIHETPAGRQ